MQPFGVRPLVFLLSLNMRTLVDERELHVIIDPWERSSIGTSERSKRQIHHTGLKLSFSDDISSWYKANPSEFCSSLNLNLLLLSETCYSLIQLELQLSEFILRFFFDIIFQKEKSLVVSAWAYCLRERDEECNMTFVNAWSKTNHIDNVLMW